MATWVNLLDLIYSVGSLYFSTSEISPAEIIGGTWSCLSDSFYPETLECDDGWRDNFYDSENSIAVQTYKRNGWAMNHGSSYGGFSLNEDAYRNLTTLDSDQRLFNKNFKTPSTDAQNDGIIFARTNIGGNWNGQNNFLKNDGLISLYSDTSENSYFGYSLCYPLQVDLSTKTYIWKRIS